MLVGDIVDRYASVFGTRAQIHEWYERHYMKNDAGRGLLGRIAHHFRQKATTVQEFRKRGEVGFMPVQASIRMKGVQKNPGEGMLAMMLRLGARSAA